MLQERGVIHIERNSADPTDDVFTIFVIENPNFLRDQAAERIESESADRSFDTMFAQLFHEQAAPLLAKSFFRKIPAATGQSAKQKNGQKTDHGGNGSTGQGARALLRNVCHLRKFSYRHADSFVRGSDIFNQPPRQVR